MKKKLVSKTYMRGVSSWEFIVTKNEDEDFFLCIKKINKIDGPFEVQTEHGTTLFIDDGYYIVEYTPMNKLYNGRVYLDRDLDEIEYYFDISNGNWLEDNIPYYDDLYLDLIIKPRKGNEQEVCDENELKDALINKEITLEEYDKAYKTLNELSEEIKQGKNYFVNLDKAEFVKRYFN